MHYWLINCLQTNEPSKFCSRYYVVSSTMRPWDIHGQLNLFHTQIIAMLFELHACKRFGERLNSVHLYDNGLARLLTEFDLWTELEYWSDWITDWFIFTELEYRADNCASLFIITSHQSNYYQECFVKYKNSLLVI